ncbi:hypothetical protein K470DRAFT_268101 [Piedraia hortae CBS 480.64]|uniref:Uncharacterized protein n=1 Tax=Piedraia hortae CBS 480.64 TaxID=1314780 RepID=A0A6A7C9G3_9PEZI|nr:hypothetical protein K470DRAFT_268101 [Piedraia hortae CBS 480.64]
MSQLRALLRGSQPARLTPFHQPLPHSIIHRRPFSTPRSYTPEDITELYATARDEFEIAAEETQRGTTYAAADREAAREELDKLLKAWEVVKDEPRFGNVGVRIRELEEAVKGLEGVGREG